jgi:abequosyltransferase
MSALRLSICIPVYNCADFLGAALDSILPQAGEGIEVLVFDGASTDGTAALVAAYQARFPRLRYELAAARGGIDADMAKSVALAHGEYCWLFSGDDVMFPEAIDRLLGELGSRPDVCVLEHRLCNLHMQVLSEYPVMAPNTTFSAELSDPAARAEWFRRATSSEAFFSFISGLVVRRECWQGGQFLAEFDRSCWGHVARLFALMKTGLKAVYLPHPWLDQRGGNDSFRQAGIVDRYRLAIEGYQRIVDHFFGRGSVEAFHVRRVLRNEFDLKMFLNAKLIASADASGRQPEMLERLFSEVYCDGSARTRAKRLLFRLMGPRAIRAAISVWWLFHEPRSGAPVR